MTEHSTPSLESPHGRPHGHKPRPRILLATGLIVVVGLGAVATYGLLDRAKAREDLVHVAARAAIPVVDVIRPAPDAKDRIITLPGTIQAWYSAPIFARVPGYLKIWNDDIGARVKQGQVLAVIDTPDLDRELDQAKADLVAAESRDQLAELTAARWKHLLKSQAVSQQTVDEKGGDADAKRADVRAAEAHVKRLEAMEAFKNLVAPFDGVVTARQTDIGDLIPAGGTGKALFQVSDIHQMRVYVRVPQAYSAVLKPGLQATLSVPQYPGRLFPVTLETTSFSIAEDSRTVLVELLAPNPDDVLLPGTFAEVNFHLPPDPSVLRLPATALIFNQDGMQVATISADGKTVMKPVDIGEDVGTSVAVVAGLAAADRVIDSPPETLINGETVRVASDTQPKLAETASNQ